MIDRFKQLDWKKWAKNALLFAGPDLIVFLGALASKFSAQGAFIAVIGLNLIIDLLRKFLASK